jgi:hypothetical protein
MVEVKAGTRLRCEACGAEFIIVRAGGPELSCCGKPLAPLTSSGSATRTGC